MAKIYEGVAAADAKNKTVAVEIVRLVRHARLKKYHRLTSRFQIHDEQNSVKKGDRISFRQTRPISKRKSFVLQDVLS